MTIEFPAHAWPKLKAALQHIADHPDEFYMPAYVLRTGGVSDAERVRVQNWTGYPFPACGTVACLAGRIVLNEDRDRRPLSIGSGAAIRALGLPGYTGLDDDGGYDDKVSLHLDWVFQQTGIQNYAQLQNALLEEFTFPEPLPEPSA